MSQRVHKFLGYGLTDVIEQGGQIADPRINLESPVLRSQLPESAEYLEWLQGRKVEPKRNLDQWFLENPEMNAQKRPTLDEAFAYEPEFGLANVLAIRPLCMPRWSRLDDPIDYVQETSIDQRTAAGHVEVLKDGLYPWNRSYIDSRTGSALDDRAVDYFMIFGQGEQSEDSNRAARALGFADSEEARGRMVPMIPLEVRTLLEFTGLFRDLNTWISLRPLLYTYWA